MYHFDMKPITVKPTAGTSESLQIEYKEGQTDWKMYIVQVSAGFSRQHVQHTKFFIRGSSACCRVHKSGSRQSDACAQVLPPCMLPPVQLQELCQTSLMETLDSWVFHDQATGMPRMVSITLPPNTRAATELQLTHHAVRSPMLAPLIGSLLCCHCSLRSFLQDLILSVLLDVACGCAHIHSKNIIWGDLKPGNVLLKVRWRHSLQA